MEFTACKGELMPKGALTLFTETHIAGQALLMTSQSWSGTEYLIRTDNIIVFD